MPYTSPRLRESASTSSPLPREPGLHRLAQRRFLIRGWRWAEHAFREIDKSAVIGKNQANRVVEIAPEALEIGDGRAAVDPIGFAASLDLAGVASSASQAEGLHAPFAGDDKADSQTRRRTRLIRQIAVSFETPRQKSSTFGCFKAAIQLSGMSRDPWSRL